MKTLTERCEIELQALALKECERQLLRGGIWCFVRVDENYIFDWMDSDYRIKPEPRVFYINEYSPNNFSQAHLSEKQAKISSSPEVFVKIIKVQEIIE